MKNRKKMSRRIKKNNQSKRMIMKYNNTKEKTEN
jgi:hypothetical protein